MCLIAIAWQAHPRYDLIVAANRDEFYDRPTQVAHWWPDAPHVYGGRDQRAGGAWCGADTAGRWAAVTNVRERGAGKEYRSRGDLVREALAQTATLTGYANDVAAARYTYRPFNLLLADQNRLHFLSNRGTCQDVLMAPGVHAISNGHWGEHWPKTERAQLELQALVARREVSAPALFALLAASDTAATPSLPATGVGPETEQLLSALFVHGRAYGTRASTLLLRDRSGRVDFYERGFDRNARVTHDQHECWSYT